MLIHLAAKKRSGNPITESEKAHYSKMFTSHTDKIRYSAGTDLSRFEFFGGKTGKNSHKLKKLEEEARNPKNLDKTKQESIYVSIKNKKFKSPEEIIDKEKCKQIGLKVSSRIEITRFLMNFYFEDPTRIKVK